MRLNNATEKQKKYLDKLEDGQIAIRLFKRDMMLINDDPRFSSHHKESEYISRRKVAEDMYWGNLKQVIAELEENLNGHLKYEERTETQQLLDMMYFKEIMSLNDAHVLVNHVRNSMNNKVVIDMFALHRESLKAKHTDRRDDLVALLELEEEIARADEDKEVAGLLEVLIPISNTKYTWSNLDKMHEEDALPYALSIEKELPSYAKNTGV